MITLTERAARRVSEMRAEIDDPAKMLRICVEKGGCSGLEYGMRFDGRGDDDVEIESRGIKIILDRSSFDHLEGSEVDFDDGLNGKGFEIHNPNANTTCGCGKSFN